MDDLRWESVPALAPLLLPVGDQPAMRAAISSGQDSCSGGFIALHYLSERVRMNRYPLFDWRRLVQLRGLLQKPKSGEAALEAVSIDAFPFLFIMQTIQGISGLVFGGAWFLVLMYRYPDFWNDYTKFFALLVAGSFILIAVYGVVVLLRLVYRNRALSDDGWDHYARRSMTNLVVAFSITCSLLIWLTDGISSPFIPFYVMVYMLILTRCSIPHPGQTIFVFYAVLFAVACGFALFDLSPPVDPDLVRSIKNGHPKEIADFIFVILSMAVPYVGTWASTWLSAAMAERTGRT